jgi:hypothetical protein
MSESLDPEMLIELRSELEKWSLGSPLDDKDIDRLFELMKGLLEDAYEAGRRDE